MFLYTCAVTTVNHTFDATGVQLKLNRTPASEKIQKLIKNTQLQNGGRISLELQVRKYDY